jgi:hypothetical protein
MALLSPRLLLAAVLLAALAFSHFTVYRKGKNDVRMEWQAAVARGNEEARTLERRRQDRADEAGRTAATREVGLRADADRARGAAGGLRDVTELAERVASESGTAAQQARRAFRVVVDQCGARLGEVAADADLARSEALELRDAWPR